MTPRESPKNAAVNIPVHGFWWSCPSFLSGTCQGVELLGESIKLSGFSKQFTFPSAMPESSSCLIFLTSIGTVSPLTFAVLVEIQCLVVLICILLITNNVQQLFISLSAICMFSFVTWFFKSHLWKIGLSFLLLHILGFFIFSGYYFSNICVLCILSHFLGFFFFFTFLMLSFGEQNFFILRKSYMSVFL